MQTPHYSAQEALTRETFLALMNALSYPGRLQTLPARSLGAVHAAAETLLDLETSFFTPDSDLAEVLARSGARALPPERAAYHFYPTLDADGLAQLQQANTGSMRYPDEGATLIVGATFRRGKALELRGPGILGATHIHTCGLPAEFWALRERACQYPLGWDVFLIDDDQLIGLPRSTQITPYTDMQSADAE